MNMMRCVNCGSHDIIEVESFYAYFREGEWIRQRVIDTWHNAADPKLFYANCPEKSLTAIAHGDTELDAIQSLGETLKRMGKGELLGEKIDE